MRTNYVLSTQVNMSLSEIDNLLPWERNTYFSLHVEQMEKEKEASKDMFSRR